MPDILIVIVRIWTKPEMCSDILFDCLNNTYGGIDMNFGHFDDDNMEYVITTPKTPLPWINYLGSNDFFTLISNTGGG